jgi:Proteasome subunit A N-terminal signature
LLFALAAQVGLLTSTPLLTETSIKPTMFRNQYDTDVTVWSPEGRLLQVRKDYSPFTTGHTLRVSERRIFRSSFSDGRTLGRLDLIPPPIFLPMYLL